MADQLPPRAPSVGEHDNDDHHNWLDFVPKQASPPPLGTTISLADHNDSVDPIENPSSWVDEFMEFSAIKRGAHRRSVSDSITFVERVPVNDNDDEFHARSAGNNDVVVRKPTAEFDKFDDDQFMSMFNGDQLGNCTTTAATTPPMIVAGGRKENSCSNPTSTSSDRNSTNEERQACTSDYHLQDQTPQSSSELVDKESQQLPNNTSSTATNTTETATEAPSSEPVMDPKRVKRILANRQSAQRSRVRKLHYISELERRVTALQSEVSMLSPRVAFLDHQRMLLNVDNSTLKAKIAALAQDKVFKDAHQDALRREIERLRQVYYQQCLQKAAAAATAEGNPVTIATASSSPAPSTTAAAAVVVVAHPPPPREAQFHEQQQQVFN